MVITIITLLIFALIIIHLLRRPDDRDSKAIGSLSQCHNWHLSQDLDHENIFAPWDEILTSRLVDPQELALHLQNETYTTQGEYDPQSDLFIQKEYFTSDLLFVYWRSSKESWSHLAGRAGYIVISKTEKKQVDFIITVLS